MRNFKRFFSLYLSLFLLTIIVCVCTLVDRKFVILNTTDSLPHGFYLLSRSDVISKGDIVGFPVPDTCASIVKEREWLPPNGILLKRVVGVPNDQVTINANYFKVGPQPERKGVVLQTDSLGRPMPKFFFNDRLGPDSYFVAFPDNDRSFDSRYFGPIQGDRILGVAKLLWKF